MLWKKEKSWEQIRNENNDIDKRAFIHEFVKMGKGNKVGPFCMIGGEAEWKYKENGSAGYVTIGDNNHITGLVTIDGGYGGPETKIGNNCYIMKHAHIGHNAQIGDNVTIACGAKIGGHTIIHSNVNIGLNAVIHQKKEIPEGCMIGMGSVVTKGLEMTPYGLYVGNPARYIGENTKHPNYPK